ncbi:MAG TPA: hypothetical protein VFH89_12020 [Sphingomicrobium sp.]|nr:hypothetical protein [Sphingomicrobium sp.]
MNRSQSSTDAADELREQAVACRRLALSARTVNGSEALRAAARQFDSDAVRIDPAALAADAGPTGQAASLVRVREALERQTAQWLWRGPVSESPKASI